MAKAVANKPGLQLLALDDNEISEAGIEAMKAILRKAGKLDALGSLEENCPDDEEDEVGDEDEGHEEADAAVDALAAGLASEHLS